MYLDDRPVIRAFAGSVLPFDNKADPFLFLDVDDVQRVLLPAWDDSQGTVLLIDGDAKRAMSWSATGYVIVEDGSVIEEYGAL